MKLMVTGHRPKDLGGYSNNPTQEWIRQELRRVLLKAKKKYGDNLEIISGMALGVDTWWAEEALALDIALLAYVPFKDQDRIWPQPSKDHYRSLLRQCKRVKVISSGEYSPQKMQIRNEAMLNDCDWCIAVWNGKKYGGTYNCVKAGMKMDKKIFCLNPTSKSRKVLTSL